MSRILLLDNYDSFTWNLHHYCVSLGAQVDVRRNDEISVEAAAPYDAIILSPGPGLPFQAGVTCEIIRRWSAVKPILGVCLGMQAIGEVFGARLLNLSAPLHGVTSMCNVVKRDEPLFAKIGSGFQIGHYHSWVVDPDTLPNELEVTAVNESGLIMAIRHRALPVRGIQFHPESVLTNGGIHIIESFLELVQSN